MSYTTDTAVGELQRFEDLPYEKPDMAGFEAEFNGLLDQIKGADSADAQIAAIQDINVLRNHFETQYTIVSIRNSVDTTDAFYEQEQDFFDENLPVFQSWVTRFYETVLASPYKATLEDKFGKHFFNMAETSLKTFKPEVLTDLQEENKLVSQYNKLMSQAKVEFDGKELTLSEFTPYEMSTDRSIRKAAVEAKFGFLADNQAELDDIFDKLVKVRTLIAQKLGYENYTPLGYDRMTRTDYDAEKVAYYRDQIQQYIVPLATDLINRQAKRLGITDMKYYDEALNFTTGNATPKGDPDWIVNNGGKMYHELAPETDEFFSFMTEHNLLDLLSKKGKSPGGYCTFLPDYKAPFIFSNFNGTSGDIDVLTHEAGHAFQIYCSRNMSIPEYYWPTYEACEIHSMSMEFFAWPWMELFFTTDTEKYKFAHLSHTILFLPYGAAVDEFQHEVYNNPEMTPAERHATWKSIEQKYLPHRDYDGQPYLEQGAFWQRQRHIYHNPFYYIDYTLAQVCALQFWKRDAEDHKTAWADYLTLCKAGGSKPFLQLVELAGLTSPFSPGIVKEVGDFAANWLSTVDDSKL